MRRLLYNFATTLSLLVFVASLGLWRAEGHLLLFRDWPWMPKWDALGFRTIYIPEYGTGWIIPCWFLCAVTGVLPLLWLRDRLRRGKIKRRRRLGLCATCGYDLRAASGRCPECGAAVVGAIEVPAPAELVNFVIAAALGGTREAEIERGLVERFGISSRDATLVRERTFGGIFRAGTRSSENRADASKDPIAWESYQRANRDKFIIKHLFPEFAGRG